MVFGKVNNLLLVGPSNNQPVGLGFVVGENCIARCKDVNFTDMKILGIWCSPFLHALVARNIFCDAKLLTQLHTNIGKCVWLKILCLCGNEISELPHELSQCKLLDHFCCSGNCLQEVPAGLKDLCALEYLDLSQNEIEEVPDWLIFESDRFKVLNLSGNPLSENAKEMLRMAAKTFEFELIL